ncbi:hypothetical protein HY639_00215 [Candidatus Woesearchaeota archaeon]|nr:hypothetical protein [Candidatus Woesearchaeota archaeon]
MKDLIARIKESCATAYYAAKDHKITPLGCTPEQSEILYSALSPAKHFHRYLSQINPFIPAPLRQLIWDPAHALRTRGDLYVYHYGLDYDCVKGSLIGSSSCTEHFADVEHFFAPLLPASCIALVFSGIEGSVLHPNLPLLVGPVTVVQETMDFVKERPSALFGYIYEVTAHKLDGDLVRDNARHVYVYDLVKRPRKTQCRLR